MITFNDHPKLAVKFTNDLHDAGRRPRRPQGRARHRALRQPDLRPLLLQRRQGAAGAASLLSDGKDEGSRFTFEDALEYARRGRRHHLRRSASARTSRQAQKLSSKLAEETGGRAFFIDERRRAVAGIYAAIQEELRSQYLIAYQSTNAKPDKKFRTVDLKVKEPGLEAKTIRGYYP